MNDNLLFQMVKCGGFYKKAHDGICIMLNKDDLTADAINTNLWDTEDEGIIEHDCDRVEKKYYEFVKANCKGVVVGIVDLIVTGYLDVIYQDACDVGEGVIPEKFYVTKTAKDTVKCAVVYYANNMKHNVPLSCIEAWNRRENIHE